MAFVQISFFSALSLTIVIYEVSNFARDLLARIHNDPVFNVTLNKSLYKRVKELDEVKVNNLKRNKF